MLQWQVKTFSEDFEQEKHDRERAEQQVKDLERQLSAYRTRVSNNNNNYPVYINNNYLFL